ncbi:MAG TPA: hypothetical protein QF353_02325 [Gammaproteobacteria bacterium]|nr:hypothetical protein [Gammaproteobacteria bacterium]
MTTKKPNDKEDHFQSNQEDEVWSRQSSGHYNPLYNPNSRKNKQSKKSFLSRIFNPLVRAFWVLVYPITLIKNKVIIPLFNDVFISLLLVYGRVFSTIYYVYSSLRHLVDFVPVAQLQFLKRFSTGLSVTSFGLVLVYSVVRLYNLIYYSKSKSKFSLAVKFSIAIAVLGLSITGLTLAVMSQSIAPIFLLVAISMDSMHSLYRFVRMRNKFMHDQKEFKKDFGISFNVLFNLGWKSSSLFYINADDVFKGLIQKQKNGKLSNDEFELLSMGKDGLNRTFEILNHKDKTLVDCYYKLINRYQKVTSRKEDWYATLGTVTLSLGLTALAIVPGYLPVAAFILTLASLVVAYNQYKTSRSELAVTTSYAKHQQHSSLDSEKFRLLKTYKKPENIKLYSHKKGRRLLATRRQNKRPK